MQPLLEEMGVPIMAQTAHKKHTCENTIFAKSGSNEPLLMQEDQIMMCVFDLEKLAQLLTLLRHLEVKCKRTSLCEEGDE